MTHSNNTAGPLIDVSTRVSTRRRDVFILGAGFSRAIATPMPTMVELGAEVRERLAEVTGFSSAIPDSLGDNIELWMTYLSQPQPWLREPEIDLYRSLGGRIRRCIAAVIEDRTVLASASIAPEWLRRLILAWHRREAVVITLNYDTLVEKAARDLRVSEKISVLQPADIYPPYFANIVSRSGAGLWGEEDLRTFRLLKLHGSVNWHYSGREDFHGETIFFSDVPEFGPPGDEAARHAANQRLRAGIRKVERAYAAVRESLSGWEPPLEIRADILHAMRSSGKIGCNATPSTVIRHESMRGCGSSAPWSEVVRWH